MHVTWLWCICFILGWVSILNTRIPPNETSTVRRVLQETPSWWCSERRTLALDNQKKLYPNLISRKGRKDSRQTVTSNIESRCRKGKTKTSSFQEPWEQEGEQVCFIMQEGLIDLKFPMTSRLHKQTRSLINLSSTMLTSIHILVKYPYFHCDHSKGRQCSTEERTWDLHLPRKFPQGG